MRSMGTRSAWGFSIWTSTAMPSNAWTRGHYLNANYYERVLTSLASLLVEKGIVPREELERRAQGRSNVATRQSFQPGDRVRVRDDYVPGHVRMPGYISGKTQQNKGPGSNGTYLSAAPI